MIVYDLICTRQHRFEGWFALVRRLRSPERAHAGALSDCDDAAIERRPSVNVQVGRAAVPAAERESAPQVPAQIQAEGDALKALRQLIASSDNVALASPRRRARFITRKCPSARSAARRRARKRQNCATRASSSCRCRACSRATSTEPALLRGRGRFAIIRAPRGPLAQLVEQRTFNPLVVGSSPARPTSNTKELRQLSTLRFSDRDKNVTN